MAVNWKTYRLLCTYSPQLGPERDVFHEANARFMDRVGMQELVLFALASPRAEFNPQLHRDALRSNIRSCDFFVHILGENAPDPVFIEILDLALSCAADPAYPMRATAALFRNPENAAPETLALRSRLIADGRANVRDFHPGELSEIADEILDAWYALIRTP